MTRKNESTLDLLVSCPWWVSVLASGIAFVFLKFIVPSINFENPFMNGVFKGLSGVAFPVALLLLIPAPISMLKTWQKKRLLDSQRNLETLRKKNWREFEELVGEAYRRQGYAIKENQGAGPDEGIDLVLRKGGDLVLVQCKHWRAVKVDVKIVRELYGVMAAKQAPHGVVITSGMFTQDAKNFAADKPIDLVDGHPLLELIGTVRKTPKIEQEKSPAKLCPRCGKELVLRTARRGPGAREQFLGCSGFPHCRYTEPLRRAA